MELVVLFQLLSAQVEEDYFVVTRILMADSLTPSVPSAVPAQ